MLVSGSGTNLQALVDASGPDCSYQIVLVLSDTPSAGGLDRARAAGIPTSVVEWKAYPGREAFTTAVCEEVEEAGGEAMVLAGFMRILTAEAIRRFPNRIVNVHPALLPAFSGAHAVPQALAHGVKLTGVTVHLVDELVDHGPIISQEAVPVLPGDTEESLHARIQAVEHRLYPEAVAALASGRLHVEARTVVWQ